ncbi:MAG: hypothetical protein B1H06_06960 [Candidatus Cloacimonas sp. 4484_143]|nr:MAG: hypothetical protein B1H06_06960 [Candidatus Cloacimonas sp. 4484_143]
MINKKSLLISMMIGLCLTLLAKKPDWIMEKPLNPEYVISIEMSHKSEENYRELAHQAAAINIADFFEITDSLSIQKLSPKIEIVKEWESKKEYWIYCRLSKLEFYRNMLIEQSDDYYIGFGECSKTTPDYLEIAKQKALSEISSQINVAVSGEVVNRVIEQSGIVKEDFFSQIQMKTQSQLEGIEVVKILETDDRYWIFYKLSKQLYEAQQQKIISDAIEHSLDFYNEAKSDENKNKIASAISNYIKSLQELEHVLNKPLIIEISNEDIYLDNKIYTSLQNLLNNIKFETNQEKLVLKSGKPGKVILLSTFNNKPIENLKINFITEKGSSEVSDYSISDANGEVILLFPDPKSDVQLHFIKGFINVNDYCEIDSLSIIVPIINSLINPEIRFEVLVEGLSFYMESVEKVENVESKGKIIEPIIKDYFISKGHKFVVDKNSAELLVRIVANSAKGSGAMGFVTSTTNATLSIVEVESSNEILKKTVNRIKGVSNNIEGATNKSFEKAARKLIEELEY